MDGVAERKLERVERDCFLAFQIAVAISKAAHECSVGQFLDFEQCSWHGIECSRQLNVDVCLPLRSHIRSSIAAICERAWDGATPPKSCRAYQPRDVLQHRKFSRGREPTRR